MCRACRDCGGSISPEDVAHEGSFAHRVSGVQMSHVVQQNRLFARREYAVVSSSMEDRAVTEVIIPWTTIYCANWRNVSGRSTQDSDWGSRRTTKHKSSAKASSSFT